MKAELRTHNNVTFVYADFINALHKEEMLANLARAIDLFEKNPQIDRCLFNFTGASLSNEFITRVKEYGKDKDLKSALVGIAGIKKILVNTVNAILKTSSKLFNNENDAMDWLAS